MFVGTDRPFGHGAFEHSRLRHPEIEAKTFSFTCDEHDLGSIQKIQNNPQRKGHGGRRKVFAEVHRDDCKLRAAAKCVSGDNGPSVSLQCHSNVAIVRRRENDRQYFL